MEDIILDSSQTKAFIMWNSESRPRTMERWVVELFKIFCNVFLIYQIIHGTKNLELPRIYCTILLLPSSFFFFLFFSFNHYFYIEFRFQDKNTYNLDYGIHDKKKISLSLPEQMVSYAFIMQTL